MLPGAVAIGASLGGLRALATVLTRVPDRCPWPTFVVQHRGKDAGDGLARHLRTCTTMNVLEAEDKQPIEPGMVYVAPAGYHMLVQRDGVALSIDVPVHHARPSVDVLFETVADVYGCAAVGVVLTGNGRDGARGLARIKARGGYAVVQAPEQSEAPGMPRAALAATTVDCVLGAEQIGTFLARLARPAAPVRRAPAG
jgi:two-component system chemotaxis response regulator CheB